jgi:ferric-dicitrate binding protein FerR (iron transport regulator)
MIVPEFENYVIRFLDESLTDEEEKVLFHLLENPSYYSLYEYYVGTWLDADAKVEGKNYSNELAYMRFEELATRYQKKDATRRIIFMMRYAAAVVLLLLFGYFAAQWIEVPPLTTTSGVNAHELNEVLVPRGSKCEMILPDGTHVWLNSDSRLIINTDYNRNTREVQITGEAYFEVAKNPDIPFIVNASAIQIKALGTAFNVFVNDDVVETSLEEGMVELTHDSYKSEPLLMVPGEHVIYNQKSKEVLVSKGDVATISSWKEKKWVIRSMTLGDLIVRLERRYDVEIVVDNQEILKSKVTASFTNESIDQIIAGLSKAFDFKFHRLKDKIIIN